MPFLYDFILFHSLPNIGDAEGVANDEIASNQPPLDVDPKVSNGVLFWGDFYHMVIVTTRAIEDVPVYM